MNLFKLRFPRSFAIPAIDGASEALTFFDKKATPCEGDDVAGFIFSDFSLNPSILQIPADTDFLPEQEALQCMRDNDIAAGLTTPLPKSSTTRERHIRYVDSLRRLIEEIEAQKGVDSKIIAARSDIRDCSLSPLEIFNRLDHRYPDACIFLFSTPLSGTWIGATPELLLRADADRISTVALAGTRPAESQGPWDAKNIEEQRIVTDFILGTLRDKGYDDCRAGRPTTFRAGPVEHLSTSIEAPFGGSIADIADLLATLSPTPALSGYPRPEAIAAITSGEDYRRENYGGFIGYLFSRQAPNADDSRQCRALAFANLRSARIDTAARKIRLFAGGGITRHSIAEEEWTETERKLATLRSILT
ncbi:MAG: chorismate-binding protein [Muribaculaceae bacterium]|nr:chorismate-binding protein [Muribaculaceae bacterium]